ncbi:nucleotidyl transferase AbiEii/AbiGii toxin family protein [Mycoavidus sp. HKI]|uniref:nucleotidyl transferase AbiEii/AbiGii toxin family protein n=1 Tax=Mycoavidus sp. HKI TaxID=2840467 RepID=UPI001CBF1A51|nr:nucleotidyl transferase AbiEii/AbiGii toxin family protein [Mycoavidus sp. HKI]UAW64973.2 nucleotidyl transferase AbiEii/AbiGii toxin family protein [Mycoavidus sp. HKI]
MNMRTQSDLLQLAGRYATERRVPVNTIVKEILHYEILYALGQSGASNALAFQGGTALRLCYQGTRYSEDLDFAAGTSFDPATMMPFADLLQREIGEAYGLEVNIKAPKDRPASDGVNVARWSARVRVPQADPSNPQNQVINIEVASVPAHDPDLVAVATNYPHLPAPHKQMLILAESKQEILADKIVALGAWPFLKARDIWDIKFLTDLGTELDFDLVGRKLIDYGWEEARFKECLSEQIEKLKTPEKAAAFTQEMSRFVDATVIKQLENPAVIQAYLKRAYALGASTIDHPFAAASQQPI